MTRQNKSITLFLAFLKTGAFTFGGGYSMIALLRSELVSRRQWLTDEQFLDMVSIAESTPGPVAVNCATYIGYRVAGIWGALLSTTAVCIPSFTIILIITKYFESLQKLCYVQYAIAGIKVCAVYLVLSAAIQMLKSIRKNFFDITMAAIVFLSMVCCSAISVSFSSVFCLLVCGMAGVSRYLIKRLCLRSGVKK